MTITPTVLTSDATLTDGDNNTASITPAANALILAWCLTHTDFDPTTAPVLTGNGITWELVAIATRDGGSQCVTLALFRGTSASPSPGSININWPSSPVPRNSAWSIEQYTGVVLTEGDHGVIQSAIGSDTGTALAVALAAFADADNMTVEGGGGANTAGLNIAREVGYTALSTDLTASGTRLTTAYLDSEDTSPTMTADLSTNWGMIAVELAAVGGPTVVEADGVAAGSASVTGQIIRLLGAARSIEFRSDLLKLIFNATAIPNLAVNAATSPATTLTIALHTADPGPGGTQATNETTYTGYARQTVARTTGGWTVSGTAPPSASPVASINFPECTANPGPALTHWSIGTGVGNRLLYSGEFSPSIAIAVGVDPRLRTLTTIAEH